MNGLVFNVAMESRLNSGCDSILTAGQAVQDAVSVRPHGTLMLVFPALEEPTVMVKGKQ